MYKANGRLEKADSKEFASSKIKVFICPDCGHEKEVTNVEFGEQNMCSKCSTLMVEQSD